MFCNQLLHLSEQITEVDKANGHSYPSADRNINFLVLVTSDRPGTAQWVDSVLTCSTSHAVTLKDADIFGDVRTREYAEVAILLRTTTGTSALIGPGYAMFQPNQVHVFSDVCTLWNTL